MRTRTSPAKAIRLASMATVLVLHAAALDAQGDAAAEVLAFERQVEEAVVRGDVAFFDQATPRRLQLRARGWLDHRGQASDVGRQGRFPEAGGGQGISGP